LPTIRLTQTIDRPASEVFEAFVHVENFPEWDKSVKSAQKLTSGDVGPDTRFEFHLSGLGTMPVHLERFERDRRVRLVQEMKSMGGGHLISLTPQGERSTRVDHELEMLPKGPMKLMGPLTGVMGRRKLRATADALKSYVESR
jgi:uncharacterized protein YndB with AHSA1/START domain